MSTGRILSSDSPRASVLVLTSTLPRWRDDPEPRFVLDLTRSIAPDFRAVILAPISPGAAAREMMDGVEVRRFRYAPLRRWEVLAAPGGILPNLRARPLTALLVPALLIAQFASLVRTLRRERFDVVHCHWIIPQGLTVALCSLLMRTPPFVVSCHGTDVYALNGRSLRWIKKAVLQRASAVTAVSHEMVDFLTRHVDERLAGQVRRIPMGVDLGVFEPLASHQAADEARVLCAGRLSEGKGVEHLLHAIATPQLRSMGLRVRIAGDGTDRPRLEEMAARLGILDRVRFLGSIPHDQLAGEMAAATALCLPSVVDRFGAREGMPTVLMEASAAGIPVVASDIGGCREFIVNGETGWLVPPGDHGAIATAILDILEHPERARRMAAAARERVREYSWNRIGVQFSELLGDLAHSEGS